MIWCEPRKACVEKSKLWNCFAAPVWRFLCAKQFEKCSSVGVRKKLAWNDLDRVSFKKIFKEAIGEIKKSAWTGLGKVKKRPLQRQVSLKFSSQLATDLLLTRGAVDATPFAVAFSLTFSLVKN
jgi:hypothetical protein